MLEHETRHRVGVVGLVKFANKSSKRHYGACIPCLAPDFVNFLLQ